MKMAGAREIFDFLHFQKGGYFCLFFHVLFKNSTFVAFWATFVAQIRSEDASSDFLNFLKINFLLLTLQ